MMEQFIGIVLFNPKIERLRENIEAVYRNKKTSTIIIIDNASENEDEIRKLLQGYEQIEYIRNAYNLGIAKALNQICARAKERNQSFVLTLDQDSVCPENILEEYEKYTDLDRLGILCPQIRDRNCDWVQPQKMKEVTVLKKCITSGSLVSLEAWEAVCGFDEIMFIDGVDHDFCARIRQKGYEIYQVNRVVLLHEIGSITVRRCLFWKVIVKNHASFRKYYIARNTVFLARKRKAAWLIAKSYLQVVKQFLIVLLYEQDKQEKLRAIIKGARDGTFLPIDVRWKY